MQKGFVPIIILVVILVLGSVGGAYYFFKVKTPEQRACTMDTKICPDGSSVGRVGPNCEFTPCPKSSPSPTADETANWKTYTNDYWKFQFQYPPTWALIPGYKPTDTLFEIINFDYEAHQPKTEEEFLSQTPIQPPPEFRIAIHIYPNYTRSEQLMKEFEQPREREKFNVSNMKQFQINSHPAIEYNLTSSTNISMVDTIIESNQKYIIQFRHWKEMNTTQDTPNYYKILSTFKFLEK